MLSQEPLKGDWKKMNIKVLVIAPSRKTRGGITSVVKAYENTKEWNKFNCFWIESQIDKNIFLKLFYFIKSLFIYVVKLPQYTVVHIHCSEPVSVLRKSLFFLVARLLNKKTIVHLHSFSPDTSINSKYSKLYKWIFTNADKVIVLSEYWRQEVEKSCGKLNSISVVYNPCTKLIKKNIEEKYILFAGTLNGRKGYSDLIKAFANIKDRKGWKLVFAGNGEIPNARAKSLELGINSEVEFLGWIDKEQKESVFSKAGVFCLPSYAEGFPMAVIDAVSYGIPVLTTPVGGILDLFQNQISALIFNPGDVASLSKAIEKIISHKDLRELLSKNATKLAEDNFIIEKVMKDIGKIYENL